MTEKPKRVRRVPASINPPELPLDAPDIEAFEREAQSRINRAKSTPIPFEVEVTDVNAPNDFPVTL